MSHDLPRFHLFKLTYCSSNFDFYPFHASFVPLPWRIMLHLRITICFCISSLMIPRFDRANLQKNRAELKSYLPKLCIYLLRSNKQHKHIVVLLACKTVSFLFFFFIVVIFSYDIKIITTCS